MPAALRKAVFWLLMLALPWHGASAAMTGFVRDPGAMQQVHVGDTASMHGATSTHASGADTPECAGIPHHCAGSKHAPSKCAPSAACSLIAGPALEPQAFVALRVTEELPTASAPGAVAYCTGALDRPPRA